MIQWATIPGGMSAWVTWSTLSTCSGDTSTSAINDGATDEVQRHSWTTWVHEDVLGALDDIARHRAFMLSLVPRPASKGVGASSGALIDRTRAWLARRRTLR